MAAPAGKPPPAAGAPPPAGGAAGGEEKAARPLGPDGKPIPGPEQMRQIQAARKMGQQQAQVEEVIGIMHKNVENVLERDAKLGALEERADALQDGCAQFEKQAAAMKNKFWLENMKAMVAAGVAGVIVLGLVYWKFMMPDANAAAQNQQMQMMIAQQQAAAAANAAPAHHEAPPASEADSGAASDDPETLVNLNFMRWWH